MSNPSWTSLIAAREARGINRAALAAAMGMNLSHLGELERGAKNPRRSTIVRAANILGVAPSTIAPEGFDGVLSDIPPPWVATGPTQGPLSPYRYAPTVAPPSGADDEYVTRAEVRIMIREAVAEALRQRDEVQ